MVFLVKMTDESSDNNNSRCNSYLFKKAEILSDYTFLLIYFHPTQKSNRATEFSPFVYVEVVFILFAFVLQMLMHPLHGHYGIKKFQEDELLNVIIIINSF